MDFDYPIMTFSQSPRLCEIGEEYLIWKVFKATQEGGFAVPLKTVPKSDYQWRKDWFDFLSVRLTEGYERWVLGERRPPPMATQSPQPIAFTWAQYEGEHSVSVKESPWGETREGVDAEECIKRVQSGKWGILLTRQGKRPPFAEFIVPLPDAAQSLKSTPQQMP